MRIWRVVKRRHEKPRTIRALLVDVVDDFRKPFFPKQTADRPGLFQIQHEPIAIVVVPGIVMIKLRRFAAFRGSADRLTIIIGYDVDTVRIRRRDQDQNSVAEDGLSVLIAGTGEVVSKLSRHLRSDNLSRMNRAR